MICTHTTQYTPHSTYTYTSNVAHVLYTAHIPHSTHTHSSHTTQYLPPVWPMFHTTQYLPPVWPMFHTTQYLPPVCPMFHTTQYLPPVWPMFHTTQYLSPMCPMFHTTQYLPPVWPMFCTQYTYHTVPTCNVAHALCVIRLGGGGGRTSGLPHQPTLLPGGFHHTPLCLQHTGRQGVELQEGLVQLGTDLGRGRREGGEGKGREGRVRMCVL